MQWSQKQKIFSNFFFDFLNLHSILNIFQKKKKKTFIADVFLNWRNPNDVVREMCKMSRFRGPFDK